MMIEPPRVRILDDTFFEKRYSLFVLVRVRHYGQDDRALLVDCHELRVER